ncbi:GGDEF domain-containing protein [Alkalihalobacterium bogoriense]|uniref:GGDEF domain-containing protein n=1 Tax=Alkalihalobacterium bogoriense TaxID=246272 RepID=UPI00047880D0|nr:GGDEF domain-containing protein [Alkalihalobacterium bogoriense]
MTLNSLQKLYTLSLLSISIIISFYTIPLFPFSKTIWILLFSYLFFMFLYTNLHIIFQQGNISVVTVANYSFSFGVFAGPIGLLLLESLKEICQTIYKQKKKIYEPNPWWDTVYNVGSSVLFNSIALYFYFLLVPTVLSPHSIYYFLFMGVLLYVTGIMAMGFIAVYLLFGNEFTTFKEAIHFTFMGKWLPRLMTAISNVLFIHFIINEQWLMLFCLFIFNFLINSSFNTSVQTIKNKVERDLFEEMAYTDKLTGAYNRNYFQSNLNLWQESVEDIGIVVTDIDNFKKVNDSYNHSVGDQVIQHYVQFLSSFLDDDDILIRTGGEEFTILLKKMSRSECLDVVNEIQKTLENTIVPVHFEEQIVNISYSASFGFYFYTRSRAIRFEKACVQADNLLYLAKKQGKNRVVSDLLVP